MSKQNIVAVLALIGASILGILGFAAPAAALVAGAFVVGETTDTTDLNAAMKIIFGDSLINNVVSDSELLDLMQDGEGIKVDVTTGGRYIETSQLFNLPAGVGARSEGGYIPVPRGPRLANGRITLKKIMGSVEITGDVLKRVRTNEGAFVDWGAQVMPKLGERLTNEVDRMLLGYGSGIKARVNDATPALTLVVDAAMGVAGLGGSLFQFLPGEDIIASPNADGTSPRTGAMHVEDFDWASNALVIATSPGLAASLADNDYLFAGDAADNSAGKECMGILGIVDDGNVLATFQNIARSSYEAWKGQVIDAQASPFSSGDNLTEETLNYADTQTYQRGGGKPDVIVTSRDGHTAIWRDMKADRTFNDSTSYTGGKGALAVVLGDRTIPIRVARKMPPTYCYGLTRSTLRKWMLREFEWDDTTGSVFRQVTDSTGRKDAFYAYGTMHLEIGSDDPQKNFRIENFDLTY